LRTNLQQISKKIMPTWTGKSRSWWLRWNHCELSTESVSVSTLTPRKPRRERLVRGRRQQQSSDLENSSLNAQERRTIHFLLQTQSSGNWTTKRPTTPRIEKWNVNHKAALGNQTTVQRSPATESKKSKQLEEFVHFSEQTPVCQILQTTASWCQHETWLNFRQRTPRFWSSTQLRRRKKEEKTPNS
jgi:hypothetical protein